MSAQWKPGQVGLVTNYGTPTAMLFVGKDEASGRENWRTAFGGIHSGPARPLVVLDPENAADVDRLAFYFRDHIPADEPYFDITQRALRSLADPKPPEPQGFAAAVRDSRGNRWVRAFAPGCGGTGSKGSWYCGDMRSHYSDIDVVSVLTEGVDE